MCSLASFKLSTLGVRHLSRIASLLGVLFDETFAQPDVLQL